MNEAHDPNRSVDVPSTPAHSLDAGLAAGEAGLALPGASAHDLPHSMTRLGSFENRDRPVLRDNPFRAQWHERMTGFYLQQMRKRRLPPYQPQWIPWFVVRGGRSEFEF